MVDRRLLVLEARELAGCELEQATSRTWSQAASSLDRELASLLTAGGKIAGGFLGGKV
ncbi:UNVERIFIED_CONTAM: hypothetical protein Sradi_6896900 [Sesamum radiatum]|uniref:Uncharacterized protein n=1 Tax=Sesamum radiatum TaxID=300843 RepID=A0AAW2JIZ0_SESRA